MKEYNLSSARGKQIYEMGDRCVVPLLSDLYDNPSYTKQKAFDWCYEQYLKSEDASAFGVGNANSFSFTASWFCTYNYQEVMRVETKDNSYIVYLDR